jgi:hypothetical protein
MALAEYLIEVDQDLWLTFQLDDPATFPNPDTPPAPTAAPTLTSLSPNTAVHGSAKIVVQLTGTGFTPISKAIVNGSSVPTAYIGGTALRIYVDPTEAVAGTAPVAVANGSKKSANVNFTFT